MEHLTLTSLIRMPHGFSNNKIYVCCRIDIDIKIRMKHLTNWLYRFGWRIDKEEFIFRLIARLESQIQHLLKSVEVAGQRREGGREGGGGVVILYSHILGPARTRVVINTTLQLRTTNNLIPQNSPGVLGLRNPAQNHTHVVRVVARRGFRERECLMRASPRISEISNDRDNTDENICAKSVENARNTVGQPAVTPLF